jgi:hypothetical protein
MTWQRGIVIGLSVLAVGCMSFGAWLMYRPAGYVVFGLLLWTDLNLAFRREKGE